MNKVIEKPIVIFSSLTEDSGHLILDDLFWFGNLIYKFPSTRIITSKSSANNLLQKYPSLSNNISSFNDFTILNKKYYRLYLLGRLISCEKIKNSRIIFQGFDEFGILFYFMRIWGGNNSLYVIPTNNVSPERLSKSKWLLQWLIKKIIFISDKFFYHTDFEYGLIKSAISSSPLYLEKCYKLKYHLIGENNKKDNIENTDNEFVISYFGPTISSKPISDFCDLMKADNYANGDFKYRIVNVSNPVKEEITSIFGNDNKISFVNEYLTHEEYIRLIQTSRYVFLPHNYLYEGKLSGILSDCISNGTPIISNNIEPVAEFFGNYGKMGFLFDFENDINWELDFLNLVNDIDYQEFLDSMDICKLDHNPIKIIHEFLEVLK